MSSTTESLLDKNQLRNLWIDVLGCEDTDIEDDSQFFDLGGDSVTALRLRAAALRNRIDIPIQLIFSCPVFKEMFQRMVHHAKDKKGLKCGDSRPLSSTSIERSWSLAEAFRRQCRLDVNQMDGVYQAIPFQVLTMPMMCQLTLEIKRGSEQQLKHALWLVQRRVRLLRARYVQHRDEHYHFIATSDLVIHEEMVNLEEYRLCDQRSFPKAGDPLCRLALITEGDRKFVVVSLSHAIADRPTRGALLEQVREALQDPSAYAKLSPISLPTDFIAYTLDCQREAMEYWRRYLSGAVAKELLTAQHEPAYRKSTQVVKQLKHASSPRSAILFSSITQAAWIFCLAQRNKVDDVVITTARSGRAISLPGIDNVLGSCASVAPTRGRLDSDQSLKAFLERLQQDVVDGLQHEAWGGAALEELYGHFPAHIFSHSPPDLHTVGSGTCIIGNDFALQATMPPRRNNWKSYVEVAPLVAGGSHVKAIIDERCFPKDQVSLLMEDLINMIDRIIAEMNGIYWEEVTLGDIIPHLNNAALLPVLQKQQWTMDNFLPQAGDQPAVILPDREVTVTQTDFERHITSLQHDLARAGIETGSTVAIMLPNGYEILAVFMAATRQRAVAAPLNPKYKREEADFYLKDLLPKVLVVGKNGHRVNGDAVQVAKSHGIRIAECWFDGQDLHFFLPEGSGRKVQVRLHTAEEDDIALILHTSGTTGRPKMVPLTHKNLITSTDHLVKTYELTPKDRTMLIMPLFHIHGLVASFLTPLRSGGAIILPPRLEPTFWDHFTQHHATWYSATPTMHKLLLRYRNWGAVPGMRFIRSCSSPLPLALYDNLRKTFNAPVIESYGMTEASHMISSNPMPFFQRKQGSVGRVSGSIELCILDASGRVLLEGEEGEICIRGPNVTAGYLDNDSANAECFTSEGYFRTGDYGRLDDEGYLTLTGRMKEFINKGGEKISPIELENLICTHNNVKEAVCFAIDDQDYGQDVGCAVEVIERTDMIEEHLKAWIRERVSTHKIPKKIWIVDTIPKTATGKVQRTLLSRKMTTDEGQAV